MSRELGNDLYVMETLAVKQSSFRCNKALIRNFSFVLFKSVFNS